MLLTLRYTEYSWFTGSSFVDFQKFTQGVSNTLFAVYKGDEPNRENCVLVRIFGQFTEKYIDRDNEAIFLWILHKLGFASEPYVRFQNGLCYGFFAGKTVTVNQLKLPKFFT